MTEGNTVTDSQQDALDTKPAGRPDGGKRKFGGKDTKVYILCGFASTLVLSLVMFDVVCVLLGSLVDIPFQIANKLLFESVLGTGGVTLLNEYVAFFGVALCALLLFLIVKPWRPYLKAYGTGPSGNRVSMLLLGLLIGFVMNAVSVIAAILAGSIQLEFVQFNIIGFVLFLLAIFVQASTEEIICRGFFYQRLNRTYGTAAAVIGSSVLFSLAHFMNPGCTPLALIDIFVTGVLYALMVRYCDSIWMAMGAHTAWNFTQNILFGLPNSGMASSYSFFGLVGETTNSFAYDTAFGVEGTLFAVAVNVLCTLALFVWGRKCGTKKPFDIWKGSRQEASQQALAEETAGVSAPVPVVEGVANVEAAAPAAAAGAPVSPASAPAADPAGAATAPKPKQHWFY